MEIPAAPYPFHHRVSCQMRFNDYDILGHLNNSTYMVLADLGKTSYFTAVDPEQWTWKTVAVVIASIKCDFYSPAFPDEPLDVLTQTVKISTSSMVLEQRVVNPEKKDQVKCIVSTVMVHFDAATMQASPIPRSWREAIGRFEGREM